MSYGKLRLGISLLMLVVLLAGCNMPVPTVAPLPTPTPGPLDIQTVTEPVIPTPTGELPGTAESAGTEAPAETTAPDLVITPTLETPAPAAWLVYDSALGLAAAAADGSSHTLFSTWLGVAQAELAPAPQGGWVSFVTANAPAGEAGPAPELSLALASLPGNEIQVISPLLSPDLQAAYRTAAESGERPPEAALAVALPRNPVWSPDGSRLAFIAALDGPTSDLYIYELASGQVRRLADVPGEAASPVWSPDGVFVVYQAVETFGTGAGWTTTGVWAAPAAGGEARSLYEAQGMQTFFGWMSPDTLLVSTWTGLAPSGLRQVNVNSLAVTPLYDDYFLSAAYSPETAVIAVSVDGSLASRPDTPSGLYLLPPGSPPVRADDRPWERVSWDAAALRFFAEGNGGLLTVAPSGEVIFFAGERWATGSPGGTPGSGTRLATWGNARFDPLPGVRIYGLDGALQQEVTTASVDLALWRPDGAGLFYVSEGALYFSALDGAAPIAVDANVLAGLSMDLKPGGAVWVMAGDS